ncbi:MAG TPA: LPS export ABC transporter permease LptG [Candidatus Polarisedimenticolia bacterium]|nr:LPS export ABC transporter permease LptG [Candidatus Polarisedimenticolia bacterium]
MSRISRYVFKEILGPALLGLVVYGLVLLMNLMLEAAELLIRRDLPASLVAQYVLLALPRILVLAIPMATLLGILVGIGRMSSDGEITALRAAGYSDRRLLVPVVALGLIASIASGILFHAAVPAANYTQHLLNAKIFLASDINREIQPRVFYERIPNLLIYADAASPSDGTLRQVLIYQRSPAGQEEVSLAGSASMRQQAAEGTIEFQLENVVSHSWQSSEPDLYQISRSDRQIIDRPPDLIMQEMIRSLAAPPPRSLREQTLTELLNTLASLKLLPSTHSSRRQISETLVELHKKFSLPATSLIFAILALPLALGHRAGGGRTWGFVVSLLVIILFYIMLTVGEQLADRDVLSPALAMWAGNILFAGLGLGMLVTGSRFDLALRPASRRPRTAAPIQGGAPGSPLDVSSTPAPPPPSPAPESRQFPSTLDRYLLKQFFKMTLMVAVSMAVLFTLFYALELVDDATHSESPFGLLGLYLLYLQPQIAFSYVIPISLCIGTLVTFALLARSHELTAIRAGGVGLFKVATPFVLVSAITAATSFGAHDAVLPYANQKANQIRDQIRNRSPRSYRQPTRRWVFGSQGLLVNFSDFNPKKQEFQDLAVFRFAPGTFDLTERVFAATAHWEEGGWLLKNGWTRRFSGEQETYDAFADLKFNEMDPPDYFVQEWKAPDQMSYRELRRYVLDLELRGYDTRELRVGLYRKVAIPAVAMVMVLIGLPFAVRVERRGTVFAVAVSILIAFVYYGVLQVFGKLGEVALLPPLLAAWAPNLLFAGAGLYLMSTARW